MAAPAAKSTPKDANTMAAILRDAGITEYEPRVINQMLEFSYKYVMNVLEDARAYSVHAKKRMVDVDDVRLAVQLQQDKAFAAPPPKELLVELARHKNSQALPLIKPNAGLRLPPDRYTLTAPNYRYKMTSARKTAQASIGGISGAAQRLAAAGVSGASKAQLTKSVAPKAPQVTVVTARPGQPSSGPSAPIIRLAPHSSARPAAPIVQFQTIGEDRKRKAPDDSTH